jgi:hypothetical protein
MIAKTPTSILLLLVLFVPLIFACSVNHSTQNNANNTVANKPRETSSATPAITSAQPSIEAGGLRIGEASGSYTAKGETVNLKFAYAGRAQRFGEESIVILLTDTEIPANALAEELKDQTMLLDGKIRGLEYAIMKDAYWVRYHPGQYQESKSRSSMKEYVMENDIVKGRDEDNGDLTDGKYSRSMKFAAAISR